MLKMLKEIMIIIYHRGINRGGAKCAGRRNGIRPGKSPGQCARG